MAIGERIKELRLNQKLTAKELSEKCGIPEKSIYKIESGGVKDPRISSVEAIAVGLGCSIDEIVKGADVDTVSTQMVDLLKSSRVLADEERNYLIYKIQEFRDRIDMTFYEENEVPEDVAEDMVLLRRLELSRNKTPEDYKIMDDIRATYGKTYLQLVE